MTKTAAASPWEKLVDAGKRKRPLKLSAAETRSMTADLIQFSDELFRVRHKAQIGHLHPVLSRIEDLS